MVDRDSGICRAAMLALTVLLASSVALAADFKVEQFEDEEIAVGWSLISMTTADPDGDGSTSDEEGPGDRDGDGIPNGEDYDPTGYLYDLYTGEILAGGLVTVSPLAGVTVVEDGSLGYYQFITTIPAVYTLTVTPPPGYEPATLVCPNQDPPPLEIPTAGPPLVLGNGEFGNTGVLSAAGCTPYYYTMNIEAGDTDVFNNNFPFQRIGRVAAPVASTQGLLFGVLALLLIGAWRLVLPRRAS